jgi:signal transduction histidine kinase
MTNGKRGHTVIDLNGSKWFVCYQPVTGTEWSMAIVCPDSDVLAGYYRMTFIVIPLLVIGLILILVLCHRAVTNSIRPLNQLLEKTQAIAAGNMEVHIPNIQREDVIGQLQNSFATMLRALNFHMGSVRYSTDQIRLRNEELETATHLVEEAEKQKTTFIQNVSHQIRTPLNIIMGFSQVLSDAGNESMSDEEMKSITDVMDHNAKHLNRMLLMLFDCSDTGLTEELNSQKHETVPCNDVAREAIGYTKEHYPNLAIDFHSEVTDDFCIETSRLYLMRALRELLYNSAKYSDGQHIKLIVERKDNIVRFVVEDTGKTITEADSENIFKFFVKVDDLTEGLGLGLPLAKRHAQTLGGDLILDTNYHEGCRFIIEIPIV